MFYPENDSRGLVFYDGDWEDDERRGQGKIVWKNGDSFEGSFANNVREGYGVEIYKKNTPMRSCREFYHFSKNVRHNM